MEFVRTQRRLAEKQQVTVLSNSICGQKNLKIEFVCAQKPSPICINPQSPFPLFHLHPLCPPQHLFLCAAFPGFASLALSPPLTPSACVPSSVCPPPTPTSPSILYFCPPVCSLSWQGFCPFLRDTLVRRCERTSLGWACLRCYDNAAVRRLSCGSFHARCVEAETFEF